MPLKLSAKLPETLLSVREAIELVSTNADAAIAAIIEEDERRTQELRDFRDAVVTVHDVELHVGAWYNVTGRSWGRTRRYLFCRYEGRQRSYYGGSTPSLTFEQWGSVAAKHVQSWHRPKPQRFTPGEIEAIEPVEPTVTLLRNFEAKQAADEKRERAYAERIAEENALAAKAE